MAEAPGWHVALEFLGAPPSPRWPIVVRLDGREPLSLTPGRQARPYRAPERYYVVEPRTLAALMPAMADGNQLRVEYVDAAAEPRSYVLALAGLAEALAWIEEELGVPDAERWAVPPQGLPEAVALPAGEAVARAGIPPPIVQRHLAESGCERPDTELMRRFEPIIEPLGDTAILYAIPCIAAAYNIAYRLYVRDTGELGGVRTLYFASYDDAHRWSGTDLLYNIAVEGTRLTALYKGRGAGDCGTAGEWTWIDTGYRLDRYAAQTACRGLPPEHWPVIFPPR